MALIHCTECGKEVIDQAGTCAQCGAKKFKPKPAKKPTSMVTWAVGAIAVVAIGMSLQNSPSSSTANAASTTDQAERKDVGLAEATCQAAAEKRANDPSSIEWLRDQRRFGYTNAEKTKARSAQPMRAKNAMGATILTGIECELNKTGSDWSVVKIKELK